MNFIAILKSNHYRHPAGAPGGAGGEFAPAPGGKWEKVGPQMGSNPGGKYSFGGKQYYVKFPNAQGQALAEDVADKVHELLGAKTKGHEFKMIDGREASVAEWKDKLTPLGRSGWDTLSPKQAEQAVRIVMASMLTKNWDVVGLEYDNVAKDKNGDLTIVDTGGSFKFRAQGGPKTFDGSVEVEIEKMLDPQYTSGTVVKPLYNRHRELFAKVARDLSKISRSDFARLAQPFHDSSIVEGLVQRQAKLVKRFMED